MFKLKLVFQTTSIKKQLFFLATLTKSLPILDVDTDDLRSPLD